MASKRVLYRSEARERILRGATQLADPETDLGARMLRQAAEKTGDAVGDGTSTATVLFSSCPGPGFDAIDANQGARPALS